jgi:ferritin-like metal-binding protein YciE
MAEEAASLFVIGLKNAHAMENQALAIMRPQASRIENYPEVKAKIEQHISETEGQIERLEVILERLGENRSALKDTALAAVGTMAALGHVPAADEILKNGFANFAFENYEIAAYKSLIALASEAGDDQAVDEIQLNLEEEVAMASWLDSNIEGLTLEYAARREAGEIAKK